MKYVLDFDRTMFDTDAFIVSQNQAGFGNITRGPELLRAVAESGISFTDFVFDGVKDFLLKHGHESCIVSSCVSRVMGDNDNDLDLLINFQNKKIELSGLGELVKEVVITGGDKSDALKKMYTDGSVFIDDDPEYVESASEIGYKSFLMRTKHNGAISVAAGIREVRSFSDFAIYV